MPRSLNSPDRLFDRTWRAGHPFRQRLSKGRRWTMGIMLLLLGLVIGGYAFVTDNHRVKAMAEGYLSGLLGGRVEVGKATLSIFQGLRLDDVNVYAAGSKTDDEEHALFSADSFLIQYNPATLLSGKLIATQIKVVDPRVHLTENIDTGQWSFQKLNPRRPNSPPPKLGDRPPVLPEILLRNATVEYSQVSAGGDGPTNSITLEGQFIPGVEPDTYRFLMQSRGVVDGVGPSVEGMLVMGTNQVQAKLSNFVVGPDVKAMLPAEVRKWVEDHQIAGALDADVDYQPKDPQHRFRVQMELGGVTATVRPAEWMSVDEVRRLELAQRSMGVLQLAGLNTPNIANGGTTGGEAFVDHLDSMLSPTPLRLDGVAGQFLFTQDGIDIVSGRGRVESNGFRVEGHIGGYKPAATIHLHITSPQTENLYVPPAPRYVSSMPGPVRDVYNRFKPQGICSFWADINRVTPGGAPQVAGELNILDGQFSYEKFSYPVQHVTGKIHVGTNDLGEPSMRMDHVRGHGVDGGPNAAATFEINGWMAPLGPEVQIHMDITGRDVVNEPLLTAALPSGAQTALHMFDAAGHGEFPKYRGEFGVQVLRDRGRKSHWTIATDIHVDDAAGSLAAFPYPLDGVSADVHIQGERLEVKNALMHRGDASLALDGNVTWGSANGDGGGAFVGAAQNSNRDSQPSTVHPDLHITAKDVPIDRALLDALPAERRTLLEKVGVGGIIDVEGTIAAAGEPILPNGENAPLDLNLAIDWRNGSIIPAEGNVLASDVTGKLQLQPEKLTLTNLHGKRGDATIAGSGTVRWRTEPPQVIFSGDATNLLLDQKLYTLLPPPAKKGWDAVHPVGTVDATVQYSGAISAAAAVNAATAPANATATPPPPTASAGYQIVLVPHTLAVTVDAVPYALNHLSGSMTVQPDLVELKDFVGHHGDAVVRASGSNVAGTWDLHLGGDDVLIDDDFRHAAPASFASLVRSLEMKGKMSFAFSKLTLAPSATTQPTSTSQPSVVTADAPSDVNFTVHVASDDATMNVGVPLEHVKGAADFTGDTHDGKLHQMSATVDAQSLTLAQRSLSDLHVEMLKPAGTDLLQIKKLQARIADGLLAGQMEWSFPDKGASRYAVAMVLQNADVRDLTGEKNAEVHGRLSASLNVEGDTNAPASRRGRGDVSVVGSDMYHIPLVLGLLQVTNLALPITSPFSEATARYSIEGERVTFEQIELRAKEMMMQGSGHLDFDTKRVKMTFTTDNTTWPKLPIIGDLLTSARHELLQIHVNGTLQDPKVSASAMNTFTTTIDQVFKVPTPIRRRIGETAAATKSVG